MEEPLVINQYSSDVVRVIDAALRLASAHGHSSVRVEHFLSALFGDEIASNELSRLGYEDNVEQRKKRMQLLAAAPANLNRPGAEEIARNSSRLQA
jgi:Clp amino terminal domain, pathogenicity island component